LEHRTAELAKAKYRLREAKDELEVRVRERTGDLTATNRALEESEERYRVLVESALDIIYSVSSDGKIEDLNPAFEACHVHHICKKITIRYTTDCWLVEIPIGGENDIVISKSRLSYAHLDVHVPGWTYRFFPLRAFASSRETKKPGNPVQTGPQTENSIDKSMALAEWVRAPQLTKSTPV
jgi:hypothetical protein